MNEPLAPPRLANATLLARYAGALGAITLALGVRLLLHPILGQQEVFLLFAPAVLIVALYGGVGPGLVAIILGAFAADYVVLEPRFTFKLHELDDQISTLLFVLAGASIVWVSERHRRAEADSRRLAAEIERSRERLREHEAHYAGLAAAVPGILFTTGEDGSYDYLNQHYYDYTALPPGSGMGLGWTAVLHPEDRELARSRWAEAIRTGQSLEMEYRIRRSDGAYRWFLCRAVPFRGAQNRIVKWFGSCMDIDDRRRAEQKQAVLAHTAQEASRVKDEFLAVLSHELRTPLNAMLGWAHMLGTGTLSADASTRAIDSIQRNAKAQAQLIEDLLDLSRIRTGKLRLRFARVDLLDVVQSAIDSIRLAAASKGIEIATAHDTTLPVLQADRDRLQQVVWNLLSNAVKFTPKGGHVDVRIGQRGSHAEVAVVDSGSGIPEDLLPHVFDRFRQGDSTPARSHGGLGLGLAIARELVEAHGGTIHAASPGVSQGATFTIALPIRAVGHAAWQEPLPAGPDVREPIPCRSLALAGIRVLVVDDDADARDLVTLALEGCGAGVRVAASASEALAALEVDRPQVLVADIGMPEQDGHSLIREVRNRERDEGASRLPAIALTAYASVSDRQAALAAGYDRHLAKPVKPQDLADAVSDLCSDPADFEAPPS
jgi:PAS domain S-box-containing protein